MGSNPKDEEEELSKRLREYTRSKGREALRRIVSKVLRERPETEEEESFLSAAKRLGVVGSIDLPPDHRADGMEGFGESRGVAREQREELERLYQELSSLPVAMDDGMSASTDHDQILYGKESE